jgi:hypothetical protein
MKTTKFFFALMIAGVLGGAVSGCDLNPTNEASADAIARSDANRAAAIDADPKMSPDQKAKMKEMLGLGKGKPEDRR